jgi:hypothetical protein
LAKLGREGGAFFAIDEWMVDAAGGCCRMSRLRRRRQVHFKNQEVSMLGAATKQGGVSSVDHSILPEEARLLERLWTASTSTPFPLKGCPTKAEAWELAMIVLRKRLRADELAGRARDEVPVAFH